MIDDGKHPVLGVRVDAVDYERAVARIVEASERSLPLAVSALAVHGVMTGALDAAHARRLNALDLVVPDGQPVRWALRWLHGAGLPDRVYGPELMLRAVRALSERDLPVYLYGSTEDVLGDLRRNLAARVPGLAIAGSRASAFRRLSEAESDAAAERIERSGARAVFVGLGCPRQEVWVYEHRDRLRMPVVAVGAAFDYHAGRLRPAPAWMQRAGLEWLYRLQQEPRRLLARYALLNPLFAAGVGLQLLGWRRGVGVPSGAAPARERFG